MDPLPDFDVRLPGMVAALRRLVETESPSHDRQAVNAVGALVASMVVASGGNFSVEQQSETGNHITARWGSGMGGILILCHMDTVFPLGTLAKMPWREQDGRLYGPGVLDMKAGIVIALEAISALAESGQHPQRSITALFTSDEEIGSPSSRALIERLARGADLVLVLESGMPDGSLKTWRKGVGDFSVKVYGRAAHSGGAHADGRNAIEEMAHQVLAIQRLTDYDRGTTVNVGVIRGGIAANVVPDEAEIDCDLRVLEPAEADRLMAALQALKPRLEGTRIEVHGGMNRPPMPCDAIMQATFEKARTIAARHGIELKASGTGGGSDANFVAPLGIPVLDGLGAIGEGYHSEREYVVTRSLAERARLLAALLRDW